MARSETLWRAWSNHGEYSLMVALIGSNLNNTFITIASSICAATQRVVYPPDTRSNGRHETIEYKRARRCRRRASSRTPDSRPARIRYFRLRASVQRPGGISRRSPRGGTGASSRRLRLVDEHSTGLFAVAD